MRFKRCRMLKYLAVKLAVVLTLIGVGIFAIHAGAAVPSDYWISLDEYDREVPEKINGWVFSNCGGDRGLLSKENIDLTWDNNSAYTVKRRAGSINPWGGMSYGLISQQASAASLDFNAIYGKYILAAFQQKIVGMEFDLSGVVSQGKDLNIKITFVGSSIIQRNFTFNSGGKKYIPLDPAALGKVYKLYWEVTNLDMDDSFNINSIRFKSQSEAVTAGDEQAFLWSYSWLCANYNENLGLVKERSVILPNENENISASAKFAKITAYAAQKGYVDGATAAGIITRISDTLLNNVPKGPAGINQLWPHYVYFEALISYGLITCILTVSS